MKFKEGDFVIEKRGFGKRGKIITAVFDDNSTTGEWYEIEFRDGGVQGSNGEFFEKDD